jgi:2-polyprenyl-3-methyl-5-hydroxy-6-metoxy-1,4-benzoquinol methylase
MGVEQPAEYYDAIYCKTKKYNRHYTGVRWLPMFEKATTLIKSDNILEIGCGVGQFAHLLHDKGFKNYTGIDFSKEAIDRCKRLNLAGYHFIKSNVYKMSHVSNFDTIIALETLEHLNDFEILSLIPKGKRVIISLPTFNNEAHLIWFKDKSEIFQRYDMIIDIDYIERISDWFLFSGVIA